MQTSKSPCNVIGVFDDPNTANRAADSLRAAGFRGDEIEVRSNDTYAGESALGSTGLSSRSPSERSGGGIAGFFRRLFGSDADENDLDAYSEHVRRGGAIVCVTTDGKSEDRAAAIMNEAGAVDIDHRVASWKQRGYQGYDETSPPFSSEQAAHEREHYLKEGETRSIPVVEEELRVGKRAVQRGGVRVYNRIREEPVEQSVNLREEHVRVDRREANRPATDAEIRRHDDVIEVTEMAEEAVIEKRTRVVEEIVVAKDATERTETVRDKVRRSDVNIEQLGREDLTQYDDDFRRDFNSRFTDQRSATYETYAPAYAYGSRMASDDRYRGRNWDDIESTLRTDYERNNPNSKWDQAKGAVKYGWEKVTNRR